MASTIECADCGTKYAVSERTAGKRVKCKTCGNVFAIPAVSAAPALQTVDSSSKPAKAAGIRAPLAAPDPLPPLDSGPSLDDDPPPIGVMEDAVAPVANGAWLDAYDVATPPGGYTPPPLPPPAVYGTTPPGGYTPPPLPPPTVYGSAPPGYAQQGAGALSGISAFGRIVSNVPPVGWGLMLVGVLAVGSFLVPAPYCYLFLAMLVVAGIWFGIRAVGRTMAGRQLFVPGGAAVLILLRIGLRIWAQTSGHSPHQAADDSSPADSSSSPAVSTPVVAPSFQSTGSKGAVCLQIVADGYPGDSVQFRNRMAQGLRPRLEAAGIGVDPASPIKLIAGVEKTGTKRATVTLFPNEHRMFEEHKQIDLDDVHAKIALFDMTGKVVFERSALPGLVQGRRNFKTADDAGPVFSRAEWDAAGSLVDNLELPAQLPSTIQHPAELAGIRERLLAAMTDGMTGKTREAANRSLGDLIAEAASLHAAHPADPECDLSIIVRRLQVKIAALPSEEPAPSLFQEPDSSPLAADASDRFAALGDEVTFKGLAIRPPRNMVIDLHSNEVSQDVAPFHGTGGPITSFTVLSAAAPDPGQKRPWVAVTEEIAAAAKQRNLFVIDATKSRVAEGRVNGMFFTRVVPENPASGPTRYFTRDGENWITIEFSGLIYWSPTPASIRRLKAGEPRSDPLSPIHVAARLATDGEAAAAFLIQQGHDAEEAVIPILTQKGPASVLAAKVLQSIGTAKSVPALKTAMHSNEPGLPAAARAALRTVAPSELDTVAEAILDLQSKEAGAADSAIKALAAGPVNNARKAVVEPMLELVFASGRQADPQDLGTALGVWRTDQTADLLLKTLNDPKSSVQPVETAMVFAGVAKDKRLVYPVIRWINTPSASRCVDSLIAMGPMAEPELMKITRYNDDVARANAAKVLGEVGTLKSIPALTAMSKDNRYTTAVAAADLAMVEIKARMAATAASRPAR